MEMLNVMTCGSVDDGKSTLLGRLIYEKSHISIDQSEYLTMLSKKFPKKNVVIDYSLLLDGLIDEKNQGITIDIAFKYFIVDNKRVTFIDSPGHKEYTRNMANAASFSNVAIVLIDASKGMTLQTKKHLEIINLFPNIKKKIICINKMDKVNYSKKIFDSIKNDLLKYADNNNLIIDEVIPTSALIGDNIVNKSKKMRFYTGLSLFEVITRCEIKKEFKNKGASVVKFVDNSLGNRTYFVENEDINYTVGDSLINTQTGETAKIVKIFDKNKTIKSQKKSRNTSIQLKEDISINKGDCLVRKSQKYSLSNIFKAKIICTDISGLLKSKEYIFKFHNQSIKGYISNTETVNISNNSITTVKVILNSKKYLKNIKENYYFARFLIIDPQTNNTSGFGYITTVLDRGSSVKPEKNLNLNKNFQKCIWLTGLPSSGKSTIAKALSKRLEKMNITSYILDGDNIRATINSDLGFTKEDRIENNRRISHIAKILSESGVLPIVATISPTDDSRAFAKSFYKKKDFILVFVKASLDECMKRDPKGLYSGGKTIKNITGIHQNFEEPKDADLTLDTETLTVRQSVNRLLKELSLSN